MKIIYLSSYDGNRFTLRSPEINHDGFYTYGWSAGRARVLKRFYPEYDIEVWRFSKYAEKYFEKKINNISYKVFPSFRIKYILDVSLKGLSALKKISQNHKIVIYLPHVHKFLVYLIAFFFKKIPIIVQDDGEIPPRVKAESGNIFKKLLYKSYILFEKLTFKYINFFCIADRNQIEYIKEVFPNYLGEITPSKGIDISIFFPHDKNKVREKLGWNTNKKYMLYIGRLEKIKNVDKLIRIWLDIKKEHTEVELVLIGGLETDQFYKYAKINNVLMYPQILNSELPSYYSAADVYTLLTLDNARFSGMGIAPAESLACGTPVVSESLRNVVGGILNGIGEIPESPEDYKKCIIKVLNNPDEYNNCQNVIDRNYTEEAIAYRFNDIITKVLLKNKMN